MNIRVILACAFSLAAAAAVDEKSPPTPGSLPSPALGPKYLRMNFGPALNWTYQVEPGNIAYKGIAVRLDHGPGGISKGQAWMLYDHDTMRVAAAWSGGQFVDWKGIAFDGSHETHASISGDKAFSNPVGPGWAHPQTGSFEDPRLRGNDNKPYGPLPREWAHFKGIYLHENKVILSYTVGAVEVLEVPGYEVSGGTSAFSRTLNVGKSAQDLWLRLGPHNAPAIVIGPTKAQLVDKDGFNLVLIPASSTPLKLKVLIGRASEPLDQSQLQALSRAVAPGADLQLFLKGGPPRWEPELSTAGKVGGNNGPFAVDVITHPSDQQNPWQSSMRMGGFDFFQDGETAALCTWLGDVWLVSGLRGDLAQLKWKRIASGLFQPLGVKIVDDLIYVSCRDQIARLHDLNGDREIDFYENFNNDHQVTEHFHEFAMGLQTDRHGNFYYAKSARHALPALVPHHGTLLKVSKDGSNTQIMATGFRAANGVCVNDDGTFFVTDQEGHWTPKNRINLVKPGGFYGNMMAYHTQASAADQDMAQPLVWITNEMDRSPGEIVRVTSERWGPLQGSLLNLSYGTGRIFLVPYETLNDQAQGGVVRLPIPDLPTGVMRGRFHPQNGQLYACGLFAWAGNRTQDGGFFRIRYTGKPLCVPIQLQANSQGLNLTFTSALDASAAEDSKNYTARTWTLKRAASYGSKHYDEKPMEIIRATLSQDRKTVQLDIPEIRPLWCMEIKYQLRASDGTTISQTIHNTVHSLAQRKSAEAGVSP